jgi:hypothetical protein
MKRLCSLRAVRRVLRVAHLTRSTSQLHALARRIEAGVPAAYEVSTFEVRRIAPAILARAYRQDLVAPFYDFNPVVPSNLAFVVGLLVAQSPWADTTPGLSALARAVHSLRVRWLLPSGLRRHLLQACESLEWSALSPDVALPALQTAFRLRRSINLWRRTLGELARLGQWQEICREAFRRPLLAWRTSAALRRAPAGDNAELVLIAELIALARCQMGEISRRLARVWLLPLICRSTGRFLPRTFAAYRLSEQLGSPAHVSAVELAGAIERGIAPRGNDDYSNLRDAFSHATWERLHPEFHDAAILTELERFASEDDRLRFWRHITPKGGVIQ